MSRPAARRLATLCLALACGLLATGCGAGPGTGRAQSAGGEVSVLYAGSLVDLMENTLGPRFAQATGYRFSGYGAGSQALANAIKGKLRRADVFISASPAVDRLLEGRRNGDWVQWYASFATAPLVIGYSPSSRFARQLRTRPWYAVFAEPGFRLGRTDPQLDPKGALSLALIARAARYYGWPGLERQLLGTGENPAQVFPEEDLIGRIQSGQLDAGFFYSNEAVEAGIPTIRLPAAIDPSATFTVTVLAGAPHPRAAVRFVRFLLGAEGRALLRQDGLSVPAVRFFGSLRAVPPDLRGRLGR